MLPCGKFLCYHSPLHTSDSVLHRMEQKQLGVLVWSGSIRKRLRRYGSGYWQGVMRLDTLTGWKLPCIRNMPGTCHRYAVCRRGSPAGRPMMCFPGKNSGSQDKAEPSLLHFWRCCSLFWLRTPTGFEKQLSANPEKVLKAPICNKCHTRDKNGADRRRGNLRMKQKRPGWNSTAGAFNYI